MLVIKPTGLDQALSRMQARAKRMNDLTPVLRVFAGLLRKETRAAFNKSISPKGERFPPLKPSTLRGRKKKKAKLSSGNSLQAQLANSVAVSKAGIKPLVDTGRARRSIGYIAHKHGIKNFYVSYLRPHVTGGKGLRPPKRNVLPYEKQGGKLRLIPRLQSDLNRRVKAFVVSGRL